VHTLWLLLLLLLFRYILSPSRSSAEERSSNTKRTKREREILQFRFISRTRHACTQRLTFADVTFFCSRKVLSLSHTHKARANEERDSASRTNSMKDTRIRRNATLTVLKCSEALHYGLCRECYSLRTSSSRYHLHHLLHHQRMVLSNTLRSRCPPLSSRTFASVPN